MYTESPAGATGDPFVQKPDDFFDGPKQAIRLWQPHLLESDDAIALLDP